MTGHVVYAVEHTYGHGYGPGKSVVVRTPGGTLEEARDVLASDVVCHTGCRVVRATWEPLFEDPDEPTVVHETVEYGHHVVLVPGEPPVWLAEPRGQAFATVQRTVHVWYGDPVPIDVVDAQVFCGAVGAAGDCQRVDGHDGLHRRGVVSW